MSVFTPAHLGKWEPLYTRLLEGETLPLTEDGTWMLGRKTGIVAVLHESEPIYIEATRDVGRLLANTSAAPPTAISVPRSQLSN